MAKKTQFVEQIDEFKSVTTEDLTNDIKEVAERAGIEPYQMTKAVYYKNGGKFPDWQFRKRGSMLGIIKAEFGFEGDLDLGAIRGTAQRKIYLAKLQREVGDWAYYENRLSDAFVTALKLHPISISARSRPKFSNQKHDRMNHALISDTHFGITIDPLEVEGNAYNWDVSARRLAFLAQSIASFKIDHRKECGGLILNFGGDLTQGIIHPEDSNVDLLAWQILGATSYLVQLIDYLLDFYPKIVCPVTTDNHMRIVSYVKGKDRARSQKYDSYNTIMFSGVQHAFRNEPRVEFIIPRTPYTNYKVFGRTHCLTHGDTYFSTGYPAKGINVAKLTAQVDHLNSNTLSGDQIQVFLAGHVHNGLYMELPNGVRMFINPSMSGVDPFAQSVGFSKSNPGQWIYESAREHVVGDMRLVRVKEADDNSDLDKVIKPFDYSLVLNV